MGNMHVVHCCLCYVQEENIYSTINQFTYYHELIKTYLKPLQRYRRETRWQPYGIQRSFRQMEAKQIFPFQVKQPSILPPPPPNCMNGRIEAKQNFSISGKMALHFTTTPPPVSHYLRKMPKFDTKFLTRASCFLSQRSFLRKTNATSKILNINRNKTWVLFINRLCSLTVMDQKHYNFINHRFHHKT